MGGAVIAAADRAVVALLRHFHKRVAAVNAERFPVIALRGGRRIIEAGQGAETARQGKHNLPRLKFRRRGRSGRSQNGRCRGLDARVSQAIKPCVQPSQKNSLIVSQACHDCFLFCRPKAAVRRDGRTLVLFPLADTHVLFVGADRLRTNCLSCCLFQPFVPVFILTQFGRTCNTYFLSFRELFHKRH